MHKKNILLQLNAYTITTNVLSAKSQFLSTKHGIGTNNSVIWNVSPTAKNWTKIMNWQDIKQFPNIHYRVDLDWDQLEEHFDRYIREYNLDLNHDFQRGHVWTEEQQISYVEFALKGPQSGREIYLNHPNWMGTFKGDFVLVDGKQRLNAALRFCRNEIPAFGHLRREFIGLRPDQIPSSASFSINIAKLKTRADVLKWYLDFNAGGTPHTKEEIDKVRTLLEKELS